MIRDNRYIRNNIETEILAHLNFGKYILDRIRDQPKENIALINGKNGTKLTYGEITQYSVDLAMSLVNLGVRPGDVVAVCSEPCIEFMPIVIGVLFTGATYTPLDPRVGKANLRHLFGLTKPKYMIISKYFWDIYSNVLIDFDFKNIITIDDNIKLETAIPLRQFTSKNYNVQNFEPANVEGEKDVALILYSSGSTGYPKGIMITHLICICNSLISSFQDPKLKTCILCGIWAHSYNNLMTFKFLTSGRTVVYYSGDKNVFIKSVQEYKVNIAFLNPDFISELAVQEGLEDYDLDSLEYIYCGTSVLFEETKNLLRKRLPKLKTFVNGYGMTETFELTSECWGEPGLKPNSVGRPGPRITLKVIDLSTQEPLGPHKYGDLCVDVHSVFKGYIGIDPSTYLDKEGFFKTGDLAYYDTDGYFYIVDRIQEMIMYNGLKMSPVEIEMVLLKYPGVKDAGVVGKPIAKSSNYKDPTAFIVAVPGYTLTEEDIIKYVQHEVMCHVILKGVKFVEKIPRNSIGKISRSELRKMLED